MRILNFAPFAHISQHEGAAKVLVDSLLQTGAEVVTVRCNSILSPGCLVLESQSFLDEAKRERICNECKLKAKLSGLKSDTLDLFLDDYLSESDFQAILDETAEVSQADLMERKFRGIPLAKYALYEFSLNLKLLPGEPIPDSHWDKYLRTYRAALVVACGMNRILKQEKPDRLITYNSRYSANRVACWLSDQHEIPHFSIHSGFHHSKRYEQLTIERGIGENYFLNRSNEWLARQKRPLTPSEMVSLRKHLDWTLKAKSYWTYSAPAKMKPAPEVLQGLGISTGKRFALALMSSIDERAAWEYAKESEVSQGGALFRDQWSWLSFLIKKYESMPDQILVIRPHPREFPNKREPVTSQAAQRIKQLADTTSAQNIIFNFPEDELSLYDLMKSSSFILNSSSSAGLEAVLFGKYVLGNGDVITAYPPEIHKQPRDVPEYSLLIDQAESEFSSFLELRLAYRWLSFVTRGYPVNISRYFNWRPFSQILQRHARDLVIYAAKKRENRFLAASARALANAIFDLLTRRKRRIDKRTSRLLTSKVLGEPQPSAAQISIEPTTHRLLLETFLLTSDFRHWTKLLGINRKANFLENYKLVSGRPWI